jgi:hypothetical protein
MPIRDELLPHPSVVHERLTVNQRERRMLRTLLKLIYAQEEPPRPHSGTGQLPVVRDEEFKKI